MSRRDLEPVTVFVSLSYSDAERCWSALTGAGIAAAIVDERPPWADARTEVQVERRDVAAASEIVNRLASAG